HGILDVDRRAEHAAIAEIPVMALVLGIEPPQVIACRDVHSDPAPGEGGTRGTALAAIAEPERLCSFRPIEYAPALRGHPARHAAQPPVQQIEMVGGLVHEQSAGVRLVAMPAAEIVRTVMGIELPLEIDGGDLADSAGCQYLLQQRTRRRIAVVERDG